MDRSKNKKVIVGMSGGVDSAVSAYLLLRLGYDVIGVTLRTWTPDNNEKEGRCCEIDDARDVARKLEIPFHVFNCTEEFRKYVTEPFVNDYLHALTPNPCVVCNRYVKWEKLLYAARVLDADFVATGHYAQVLKLENGRYTVKKAVHESKDQSYMLYNLTQEQLSYTLLPLGGLGKDEVRNMAAGAGFEIAHKPDSQEICFVTDGHYTDYIIKNSVSGTFKEGNFVDEKGRILGRHRGIIFYTVGQRKGLGLPLGYPAYVKSINPETNEVVIGTEDSVYCDRIICDKVNYLSIPELSKTERMHAFTKIRYHHKAVSSYLEELNDNRVGVFFDEPVKAPSPGQSAVFYDENDNIIGGGRIIDKGHMIPV